MPANLNRKQQREIKAVVERAKKDNGIPQTAQQSIPFQRMFPDGICRVTDSYYTKTIQFQDINYQLAQQEDKTAIFDEWCSFLNFFDSSIHFELSFMNLSTDAESFEKSIRIPFKKDSFNPVRAEYSQMLKKQLAQGNNGLTKTKYLTFGIEAESMRQAKPRLNHTEGSCEVGGTRTYTAKVTFEGKDYTDTKTEPVPAKGHTLTAVAEVPATCETAGTSAHWKCDVCGKLFSDAEGNTETTLEKLTIPATGHAYGEPVWKWNDDFTASATFTCGNNASHVETVNATVTNEVTTEATCETTGVRTYTA